MYQFSDRSLELQSRLQAFMDEHIFPNEDTYHQQLASAENRWAPVPLMDELKAQMTTKLTQASQFFVSADNELANNAINEVMAFIENPKGFTISAKPEEPLQFVSLMGQNPENWADALNIEVKSF